MKNVKDFIKDKVRIVINKNQISFIASDLVIDKVDNKLYSQLKSQIQEQLWEDLLIQIVENTEKNS